MTRSGLMAPWRRGTRFPAHKATMYPFATLGREIDDLFDQTWEGFDLAPFGAARREESVISPNIDVSESDNEFKITAELPGMDENDIEVVLADDRLTIKGEKKAESAKKEDNFHLVERSYGSFERSFRLPPEVAGDKTAARFDRGLLTVTVPKTAAAKTSVKKIGIKKS